MYWLTGGIFYIQLIHRHTPPISPQNISQFSRNGHEVQAGSEKQRGNAACQRWRRVKITNKRAHTLFWDLNIIKAW